ncbi:MAG: hypothetical protein J6X01_08120 [Bacteroidales bacterium]|jgi:hypothetical protein|nr:hypothetical protein [Bacteroidales bacterium]
MKKTFFLIPIIAVAILLTMTQCKKDYSCGLRVECHFSTTGLDTGNVVAGAVLNIYPGAIAPGRTVLPEIEAGKKGVTDKDGTYTYTYPYEALLNITATYTDSVTHIDYRGTAQVKLQEGETVDRVILMMPNI